MSRTKRNQARTIRLGKHLGHKKHADGTVRDGTPTHHGASCSRGGSCEYCARNRQFDKIRTEKHSANDMAEEEGNKLLREEVESNLRSDYLEMMKESSV